MSFEELVEGDHPDPVAVRVDSLRKILEESEARQTVRMDALTADMRLLIKEVGEVKELLSGRSDGNDDEAEAEAGSNAEAEAEAVAELMIQQLHAPDTADTGAHGPAGGTDGGGSPANPPATAAAEEGGGGPS